SLVLAAIITLVFERWVSPRMEGVELDADGDGDGLTARPDETGSEDTGSEKTGSDKARSDDLEPDEFDDLESAALDDTEKRGLRNGSLAGLVFLLIVGAVTAIPGSPLRGEEGEILTGPAIMSVSILIALLFV